MLVQTPQSFLQVDRLALSLPTVPILGHLFYLSVSFPLDVQMTLLVKTKCWVLYCISESKMPGTEFLHSSFLLPLPFPLFISIPSHPLPTLSLPSSFPTGSLPPCLLPCPGVHIQYHSFVICQMGSPLYEGGLEELE